MDGAACCAALVMVYVSKLRVTAAFLKTTPLSMFSYKDTHELHVYCGWVIVFFSAIHTFFHLARWGVQGNLYLLTHHVSGVTGLVIVLSCACICLPMLFFRDTLKYEIRKNLHYLFIVFGLALCFHTTPSAMPNGGFTCPVFGTLLIWWMIDASYR